MTSKPTFFLLNESYHIPIKLGPQMLGALCEKMEDPLSCWKPDDASSLFSSTFAPNDHAHTPQMSVMNTAKIEINKQKSQELGGILQGLLEVMWSRTTSQKYEIDAQLIRTVRLPQHEDMFNALLSDKTVQKFREARKKNRYFMITGYKSCVNGLIRRDRSKSSGPEIEIDIPFELLLTSLGVPVPPGLLPQVGVKNIWTTTVENLKGKAAYGPRENLVDIYLDLPIPAPMEYCLESIEVDDEDGDDPEILGMEVDPTAKAPSNTSWIFIE
ncbi:hypothetical protein TWF106_003743 [Orbilia oligospora]|uniref:Uncharacterized protein n=1 Tax=Orbilia oligospora TaxID=2813651 RepID=A0A7C8UGX4_ORBOL|nr:hypothetical protein TWF106_003743 [Orbilia oligospora]